MDLPPGSIVLFRYGRVIAGEAVVCQYTKDATKNRTVLGQETHYEANVESSPSSIRVFAPPLRADELQTLIGDTMNIITSAQPYYRLEDRTVYPQLLAAHVGGGGAFL